jgi:hypothetical protein
MRSNGKDGSWLDARLRAIDDIDAGMPNKRGVRRLLDAADMYIC